MGLLTRLLQQHNRRLEELLQLQRPLINELNRLVSIIGPHVVYGA